MSHKERLKGITIKMEDESTEVSTKLGQKQENCRDDMSHLDLYMNFEEVASAIQRSLCSFRSDCIDRKDVKHAIKVIRTALKIMIGNEVIAIHNIPGMNAKDFGKESQAHVENPEIDDGFYITDQDCNAADHGFTEDPNATIDFAGYDASSKRPVAPREKLTKEKMQDDIDNFVKLLRHRGSRNPDKKPGEYYGWSTGKNYISPDTLEAIDNRSAEEIAHSSWMDPTAHDKDKNNKK